ncbi:MAG TPA: NrdH-redoxin [Bacteroidetes bacterium]|nr:NrdH-redoxin [Bacteroidota bacterium]
MLFDEVSIRHSDVHSIGVPVIVYGTRWCAKTQMIRRYLDRLGVPYSFIDLDSDPLGKDQLRWLTGGHVLHPTVYVGGHLLIEPDTRSLGRALAYAAAE